MASLSGGGLFLLEQRLHHPGQEDFQEMKEVLENSFLVTGRLKPDHGPRGLGAAQHLGVDLELQGLFKLRLLLGNARRDLSLQLGAASLLPQVRVFHQLAPHLPPAGPHRVPLHEAPGGEIRPALLGQSGPFALRRRRGVAARRQRPLGADHSRSGVILEPVAVFARRCVERRRRGVHVAPCWLLSKDGVRACDEVAAEDVLEDGQRGGADLLEPQRPEGVAGRLQLVPQRSGQRGQLEGDADGQLLRLGVRGVAVGGEQADQAPGLALGGFALVLHAAAVFLRLLALPLEAAARALVQVPGDVVRELEGVQEIEGPQFGALVMGLGGLLLFHGVLRVTVAVAQKVGDGQRSALPHRYDATGEVEHGIEGEEAGEQSAWIDTHTTQPNTRNTERFTQRTSRRWLRGYLQVTCCFQLLILTEVLFILAWWHSDGLTGEGAVPALNDTLFLFTCKDVSANI